MHHQIFERNPVEVFHRIVKDAVGRAAEIEDGDGVGVSEAAGVLHFLFEAAYRVLARAFFGQELDRRRAPQKGVLGEVDDPHPTFADAFYQGVLPNFVRCAHLLLQAVNDACRDGARDDGHHAPKAHVHCLVERHERMGIQVLGRERHLTIA